MHRQLSSKSSTSTACSKSRLCNYDGITLKFERGVREAKELTSELRSFQFSLDYSISNLVEVSPVGLLSLNPSLFHSSLHLSPKGVL